ncbi:MAG: hypothetical protein ACOYL6_02375 [Bacteriovoracaceae bacterium]
MKFRFLSVVLLASMAFSAFAAKDVELNGAQANLGNLGDVRNTVEIANNGDFTLVRSEKTEKRFEILLQVQEPQTVCARTETSYYPCNCNNNGGYHPTPRPPHGYPGYPYPGNPYPGNPYPGNPYPGNPYPGPYNNCGVCSQVTCVEFKSVLVTDTKNIKINFRRAEKLEANDQEIYDLKVRSNGNSLSYELGAPNQYKVKKILGKNFKIKKN